MKKSFPTSNAGEMIAWVNAFARQHGAERVVFAYEASGQGFGLYDDLTDAGIECYVLAPTHLPHSAHQRKNKTDEKDAAMILDEVRAHVLAGRKLPAVWVPDAATRDDREPVRLRLQLGEERTRIKNQIRNLAKRARLAIPPWFTKSGEWSKRSVQWLRDIAVNGLGEELGRGLCTALNSLMDLYHELCRQMAALDKSIAAIAKSERYSQKYRRLRLLPGVGTLTAMVLLTELGDLERFANRRNWRPTWGWRRGLRVGQLRRSQGAHHAPGTGARASHVVSSGVGGPSLLGVVEGQIREDQTRFPQAGKSCDSRGDETSGHCLLARGPLSRPGRDLRRGRCE